MDHHYQNLTILLCFIIMNFILLFIILISYFINHFTQLKRIVNYGKTYLINILCLILCNPIILNYFKFIVYNYEMYILLLLSLIAICYSIHSNIYFLKRIHKKKLDEKEKIDIKFLSFILILNSLFLIINYIYNLYFAFYI